MAGHGDPAAGPGDRGAILAGGAGPAQRGAGRYSASAPARVDRRVSYSLYLWHWPFLIAAEGIWGDLRVRYALLVVLASAVPAWLSYRYVENPIRTAPGSPSRGRPAHGRDQHCGSDLAGIAVIASFGLVNTTGSAHLRGARGAGAHGSRFADIDWADVNEVEACAPPPSATQTYRPSTTPMRRGTRADGFKACEFGDLDSDTTVALVGDSKAAQWFTPVERIADKAGWRLVVIAKNGCQFADVIRLVANKRTPRASPGPPGDERHRGGQAGRGRHRHSLRLLPPPRRDVGE